MPKQWGDEVSSITITLSDDLLSKLHERATQLGITPEELIHAGIEELLTIPDESFQRSMDHVLKKNAELYRRLA